MVLRDKLLEKRGLGLLHPVCAFIYLVMALILTMFTMNPMLIGISQVFHTRYILWDYTDFKDIFHGLF